jgi:hypothetical protein
MVGKPCSRSGRHDEDYILVALTFALTALAHRACLASKRELTGRVLLVSRDPDKATKEKLRVPWRGSLTSNSDAHSHNRRGPNK